MSSKWIVWAYIEIQYTQFENNQIETYIQIQRIQNEYTQNEIYVSFILLGC